jgi:hypothetical protein
VENGQEIVSPGDDRENIEQGHNGDGNKEDALRKSPELGGNQGLDLKHQNQQTIRDGLAKGTSDFFSRVATRGTRFSKELFSFLIWLPADISVGLSKGFHNTPKLYHDRTVKPTPRVISLHGGLRAAREVSRTFFSLSWESN